ncbi:hypothetical protein [Caballeronia insecticola]|uniref:hypothetical protein n=1 Tax=Caballeronia insecticola TaxID=758793 RepID=UPI001182F69B|nr:hypothetical protein [Caballeronia insecticola]
MNSRLAGGSRSSGSKASGGSGFDWLGAAESVAGAVFGGEDSTDDSGSDFSSKSSIIRIPNDRGF